MARGERSGRTRDTRDARGAGRQRWEQAARMFLEPQVGLRRVAGAGRRVAEAVTWTGSQGNPLVAVGLRRQGFLRRRAREAVLTSGQGVWPS